MHIKYCKAILGVHRKSTNFAVLFELGRNPLYHKIIKALLYHWFRLGTLNPFCPTQRGVLGLKKFSPAQ